MLGRRRREIVVIDREKYNVDIVNVPTGNLNQFSRAVTDTAHVFGGEYDEN